MTRETYKGRKLSAKRDPRELRTMVYVNGRLHGYESGRGPEVEAKAITTLRGWVDFADQKRLVDPTAFEDYWYKGATVS